MRRRSTWQETRRSSTLDLTVDRVWPVVASGFARSQWYVDAAPFVLRGALDRLLGGEGRRWAPPGTHLLSTGDTAGFWRVTRADHDEHVLELTAAVRAPGRVVLTTSVDTHGECGSLLRQCVAFRPSGLAGHAYLVADLPARETVLELTHRRLLADLGRARG